MKHIIQQRKEYRAFSRGSLEFLHPQNRKVRAADCGRRFRFSSGATIGGVDTTSRGNSKSLASLLYAYAVPDDARGTTVRHRVQNSKAVSSNKPGAIQP